MQFSVFFVIWCQSRKKQKEMWNINVGNVLKNFCCKAREKEVKMEKKCIKRFLTLCESVWV